MRIKNGGSSGYHTEAYGDAIVVERTFNRAGTSAFKLKSSLGKLVSTRKADLDDISDFFALQLDNPISVLSQDMARSFLSSSSPHDKYKFFIKGVNLDQLHHDYLLLEENIEQIQVVFDDRLASVDQLKAAEAKAKSLLELVGKQDAIRAKMEHLRLQMAWAQVEDQEKELIAIDKHIEEAEAVLRDAQSHVTASDGTFVEKTSQRDQAREALDAKCTEKAPLDDEKQRFRDARDATKEEVQDLQVRYCRLLLVWTGD